jgi:hypothetical protein
MAVAPPNFGTIAAACRMIGGDKPVHPSTFYRGVRAGRYSPPVHPAPKVSRVDLDKLAADLRALTDNEGKKCKQPADG